MRVVLCADDEHMTLSFSTRAESIRHIEHERGVAACVIADHLSVQPDACPVIDRTEVKQQALPVGVAGGGELGLTDLAAIPDHGVVTGLAHSRCRRLLGERHDDRAWQGATVEPALRQPGGGIVIRETPFAVDPKEG